MMKTLIFIVIATLFSGTASAQSSGKYPVKDERHSVIIFPVKPDFESNTAEWEGNEYVLHIYKAMQKTSAGNITYAFGYFDYPSTVLLGNTKDQLLDKLVGVENGKNIMVLSPGINSKKNVILSGYPGREYLSGTFEGSTIYLDTYLAGNRLYFIQVAAVGEEATPFVNQFRNSLKLK